jgi:crossover junction endodeoxyribonuclease RuvC
MYKENLKGKVVLAIDPGFDRVGIAILMKDGGSDVLLFSSCVQTNKKETFENRLLQVFNVIEEVILKYKPNTLAIESLFMANNQKSVIGVAQARGIVLYLAAKHRLLVCEYTPMQVKVSVAGVGSADKKQILYMVEKILKNTTDLNKKIDDEIDAIAIGLTCLAYLKNI